MLLVVAMALTEGEFDDELFATAVCRRESKIVNILAQFVRRIQKKRLTRSEQLSQGAV